MKLEVLSSEKDFAEFRIEGEKHSLPNLLKQKLLQDKKVEFVSYILEHPLDSGAKFVLRTSGKTPKKALEDAAKDIESDIEDFEKQVRKAFK